MKMERITIELPIVKVESGSPIWSSDFAKEHYEFGLFVVDDGIMRNLVFYDGCGVCNCPCPNDVIEKYIVEKTTMELDAIYHRDMEELEKRLDRIESKIRECRDKCDGVINNFVEVRDDLIDTIDERFSNVAKIGDGVSVLDVAKGFAIIQKPELIVELNK
jgi:hypothetical protein